MISKQKMNFIFISLFFELFIFGPLAHGKPTEIRLSYDQKWNAPRWIYEKNPKGQGGPSWDLYLLRKAERDDKTLDCLAAAKKAKQSSAEIKDWIAVTELKCSLSLLSKVPAQLPRVEFVLKEVESQDSWFYSGPQAKALRTYYAATVVKAFELDVASKSKDPWNYFDRLQNKTEWLDSKGRAKFYKIAGDLALRDKKETLAKRYYEKSQHEEVSNEVAKQLIRLGVKEEVASQTTSDESLLVSGEDEAQLLKETKESFKKNDYLMASESGVRFINSFPGSVNTTQIAKQILSAYMALAGKTEDKSKTDRDRLIEIMSDADTERILLWSQAIVSREYFSDAVLLADKHVDHGASGAALSQVLSLVAQSAFQSGNFQKARKVYEKIFREHMGQKSALEALFRLGLMDYREGKWTESIDKFARLIALTRGGDFDLGARYWQFRAAQKANSDKAKDYAEELIKLYPLSYYGLRVKSDLSGGQIELPDKLGQKISVQIELTETEHRAWKDALQLLEGGWFPEAQAELSLIPEPASAKEKLVWSMVWSQAFDYLKATEVYQRALELDPGLLCRETLVNVFPSEYLIYIDREAARYQIPRPLILGLIKQESAFKEDAKSPVGAMGVMQLLPSTAREVARDLRVSIGDDKDLFNPDINIRVGAQYLSRRLRAFDGHVPLALASYNAGIGNIRNWISARGDLKDLTKVQSSTPESEIWFDELPWSETSYYIKAILRNYLIYRMLGEGRIQIEDPVWPKAQKG